MGYILRLRVKEVAQEKNISMNKLSQRSEVSYNIVKASCRDPYREITLNTLNRLAAVLDVPPTDLLESISEEQAKAESVRLKQSAEQEES